MDTRVQDCLNGKEPNYLYPFFVVRRQSELQTRQDIMEELDAVVASSCGGIYIETRYDNTWGDEEWFDLIGFVLEECRKRDIKVWLLDDSAPPSGKVRWAIPKKHPELRRKALVQNTVDVIGPIRGAALMAETFMQEGETIHSVIAYKVEGTEEDPVYTNPIDLTANVKDNMVIWDAPEGFWRVFLIFNTQTRGVKEYWDYVDVLSPESCRLMITEAYEPHYERFAEYFGNTLAGFFTDEPVIGNMAKNAMNYAEKLGDDSIVLPWREDLVQVMAAAEGWTEEETRLALPAFWRDIGGKTASIRRRYMDILTQCYSENFVKPLGQWCTDHGVLYTGHLLEDMNAHFRFGWGTGHFFRSQEGQHTSGIDLVLHQLKIGGRDIRHACTSSAKYSDSHFYLYYMGRLGTSCAHLYPQLEGRIMCENAGPGGWSIGLSDRKYMLDAMLVASGCNLVSSAMFNPHHKEGYPPFTYGSGENPQFTFAKPLMQYVNRMCHMLTGGVHVANGLVYYNAEGDWAGDITPPQKTVAPLAQAHIDYEIAPWDLLKGDTLTIENGKLKIHHEVFDALVIPYSEYLPAEILNRFDEIAKSAPVIFADGISKVAETGEVFVPKYAVCMNREVLPAWFKNNGFVDYKLEDTKDLMHYHLRQEDKDLYLFFNISSHKSIDAQAQFPCKGDYAVYDAWNNTVINRNTADGNVRLRIPPKGTLLLVFGAEAEENGVNILPAELDDLAWTPIAENTPVTMQKQFNKDRKWQPAVNITAGTLRNLAPDDLHWAGIIKYTMTVTTDKKMAYIDLGDVGEVASVTVNGVDCGMLVTSPFRFRVAEAWVAGENTVEITVASNCGYQKRDDMSKFLTLPPVGLLGPIQLA